MNALTRLLFWWYSLYSFILVHVLRLMYQVLLSVEAVIVVQGRERQDDCGGRETSWHKVTSNMQGSES